MSCPFRTAARCPSGQWHSLQLLHVCQGSFITLMCDCRSHLYHVATKGDWLSEDKLLGALVRPGVRSTITSPSPVTEGVLLQTDPLTGELACQHPALLTYQPIEAFCHLTTTSPLTLFDICAPIEACPNLQIQHFGNHPVEFVVLIDLWKQKNPMEITSYFSPLCLAPSVFATDLTDRAFI